VVAWFIAKSMKSIKLLFNSVLWNKWLNEEILKSKRVKELEEIIFCLKQ
jgi:hypothetical protein